MKKLIAEKFLVMCPKCNKPAIVAREFDNGEAECIHNPEIKGHIKTKCKIELKDITK